MQHSATHSPASSSPQTTQNRHILRWAVCLVCAGLLLYFPLSIGAAGLRVYGAARQVAAGVRGLDSPSSADWGTLQARAAALTEAMTRLQRRVRPIGPLLRGLGFVPRYGPLLASSEPILDAGGQAATLLEKTLAQAAALDLDPGADGDWVRLGPALTPLADGFAALDEQMGGLPLSDETAVGRRLQQLRAAAALAATASALGDAWPDLLGTARPATYLILVQNNHELRATGGFISALAPATWREGRLQPIEFVDSYAIFDQDLAYPPAPLPMQRYMEIQLLTLRDGNWSPDLPTSARLIRTLYQQHTGLAVDGVITLDLDAVALLLPAFGQLRVPGVETPIGAANVESALVALWNEPVTADSSAATPYEGDWWAQRKDFVGQLAGAAFSRLQAREVDAAALAAGMVQALDRRAVQVVLFNPAAQAVLKARGWDGAMQPQAEADYLAVVDTNMGYNKVDAVLARSVAYQVTWPDGPNAAPVATLTLTYAHPLEVDDPVCAAKSYYGAAYEEMIARCYFDYSRVYVPAGSELLDVQGWLEGTVTSRPGEAGTWQWAGYFVLPPGSQHQVTLRYRLPPTIQEAGYRLVMQRQAGTDPLPVTLAAGTARRTTTLVDGRLTWQPGE